MKTMQRMKYIRLIDHIADQPQYAKKIGVQVIIHKTVLPAKTKSNANIPFPETTVEKAECSL